LVAPELTDDLVESMADGCLEQAGGRPIDELERLRDDYVINVMRALRPLDLGAGRIVAEREARIHAASIGAPWAEGDDVAAPLDLYRGEVEPDWVDYNGHMSEWAFLTAFGWASDKLFRFVGIDEEYRDSGSTFFTVETHINYLREASLGDPLRVTTQVLGVDAKRLHLFHAMEHAETGDLLATTEQMLLHVDTDTGRTAPIHDRPAAVLAAAASAHADLPVPPQVGRVMSFG
jgi:carnitine 3-dehydrogenase